MYITFINNCVSVHATFSRKYQVDYKLCPIRTNAYGSFFIFHFLSSRFFPFMYIVTQSVYRCLNVWKGMAIGETIGLLIRKKRYEKLLQTVFFSSIAPRSFLIFILAFLFEYKREIFSKSFVYHDRTNLTYLQWVESI